MCILFKINGSSFCCCYYYLLLYSFILLIHVLSFFSQTFVMSMIWRHMVPFYIVCLHNRFFFSDCAVASVMLVYLLTVIICTGTCTFSFARY